MEIILVKYQTALNVFFFFSMAMDGKILQFRKNCLGFPGSSAGKESICNARETGLFLCQEVPLEKGEATHSSVLAWRILMDRGAWWTAVHGVAKSCLVQLSTPIH